MNNNTNNNANPNNLDLAAIYGITPYIEGPGVYNVPTLEEIASYSKAQLAARLQAQAQSQSQSQSQSQPQSTQRPSTMPQPGETVPAAGNIQPTFSSTISQQTSTPPSTTNELEPIMPYDQPFPVTADSIEYLNGFLRTQLGKRVKLEFIVGTSNLESRDGLLLAVGANFILINIENSNDLMACDFYNLKFVTFYY